MGHKDGPKPMPSMMLRGLHCEKTVSLVWSSAFQVIVSIRDVNFPFGNLKISSFTDFNSRLKTPTHIGSNDESPGQESKPQEIPRMKKFSVNAAQGCFYYTCIIVLKLV